MRIFFYFIVFRQNTCGILKNMGTSGYYTATVTLYIIAALILLAVLFYSAFVKKDRTYSARLFWASMAANLAESLLGLTEAFLTYTRPFFFRFITVLDVLYYISIFLTIFLFTMYLVCRAGYEDKVKKRFFVWMLPFLAAGCVICIYYIMINSVHIKVQRILFMAVLALILPYIAVSFGMLWKIDRMLTILPAMLLLTALYFSLVLIKAPAPTFVMTVCFIYIYLSLTARMLLIHLGGIILTICVMTTLIIGNMVTSSAFVSYLKTIHDRNDSHLSDVIAIMESYEALPWLMNYWIENADVIATDRTNQYKEIPGELSINRLSEVTSEQAEKLTPSLQLFFAETCYSQIASYFEQEYLLHNLDDLFLIVPYDSSRALIIFDAEKNVDGSYRIGQYRNMNEERLEWDNYNTVLSDNSIWIWGQYSNDDDFGFYRTISYGNNKETAFLCNSFARKEVYEHLNFISSSRERAIRYLILSAFLIIILLYFMVLRPLAKISNTVKRYHLDKDAQRVEADMAMIRSNDEMGSFAEEFSSLAREMERYTARVAFLAGEEERTKTELRMASEIQTSAIPGIFPAYPDRKDFDIFGDMKPAKSVGGDFYDFFLIDDHRLAFLIADASGKGIPAALFMMSVKNLISYRAHGGGTPGRILTDVNTHLCRNNTTMMFVTVWLGILDLSTGTLNFSRAGHEPPAVKCGNKSFSLYTEDDFEIAIGVMEEAGYPESSIKLAPGDVVFLYTDGITEAMNAEDEMYGPERMLACLDGMQDNAPEEIIRKISEDVASFVNGAEQYDDLTMLAVKYYG